MSTKQPDAVGATPITLTSAKGSSRRDTRHTLQAYNTDATRAPNDGSSVCAPAIRRLASGPAHSRAPHPREPFRESHRLPFRARRAPKRVDAARSRARRSAFRRSPPLVASRDARDALLERRRGARSPHRDAPFARPPPHARPVEGPRLPFVE